MRYFFARLDDKLKFFGSCAIAISIFDKNSVEKFNFNKFLKFKYKKLL